MALHPSFPTSPYEPLIPEHRWFPADETLRNMAYEKLLPPLVAKLREEVCAWRADKYVGTSTTSAALLRHWFESEHLIENADGSLSPFRYYFAQREAVERTIWLFEVRRARDKYDLLRFDASGAVSSGMFDEDWPRYVLKMATGAGKTKVLSPLIAWSFFHKLYEPESALSRNFLVIARRAYREFEQRAGRVKAPLGRRPGWSWRRFANNPANSVLPTLKRPVPEWAGNGFAPCSPI